VAPDGSGKPPAVPPIAEAIGRELLALPVEPMLHPRSEGTTGPQPAGSSGFASPKILRWNASLAAWTAWYHLDQRRFVRRWRG
jgi:hypothetical protein